MTSSLHLKNQAAHIPDFAAGDNKAPARGGNGGHGAAARTAKSGIIGQIFEIQRFSIHDGPGIRTTVFMKGCPLRCLWCHNPEGMARGPLLSFLPEKCIGCGYCFSVCPQGGHKLLDNRHVLERGRCLACGRCAEKCYAGALERVGRDISVEDALDEVLKDKPFYETSGGGMTLSGGEPLLQIDFTAALLGQAKAAGLHCAIETCGQAEPERFDRIRPFTDLFLYDIKETDPERHLDFTGVATEGILANLRRLHDAGASVLVRLPIVPGLNDRPDHFAAIARLAAELPGLLGFEVMPYHRLGTSKLKRFGLEEDRLAAVQAPSPATVADWVRSLRALGVKVRNEIPNVP